MKRILTVLLVPMALIGCASSGVVKYSEHEMYITEASNWGISHGTLRMEAIRKAKELCGEKNVKTLSDETGGITGLTATTVNLKIRCE